MLKPMFFPLHYASSIFLQVAGRNQQEAKPPVYSGLAVKVKECSSLSSIPNDPNHNCGNLPPVISFPYDPAPSIRPKWGKLLLIC